VSATTVLLPVLLVAASAVCGVAIWALIEGVKTARSARKLTDDLDERLVPILEKADVTVDAMNAELLRIDQIVTRVEDVTERLSDTSRAVQEVANAPAEIVNDLADRVRHAWKTRRRTPRSPQAEDVGGVSVEDAPFGGEADPATGEASEAQTAPNESVVDWVDDIEREQDGEPEPGVSPRPATGSDAPASDEEANRGIPWQQT
jgi:hypothetical protein